MKDLFMALRKYGRVSLHTTDKGQYYTRVIFSSPKHTEINVVSKDFDTPEEAIEDGIAKCKETVSLVLNLKVPT
jgi:hypothetical protein